MNAVPAPWRRGLFVVLVAGFAVAGCDSIPIDYFDPDAEATREDFKAALAARPAEEAAPAPPIPELQPIISTPALGPEVESRRVTVTLTETTPLKDVLIELAREARIDLELDPRIEGGIIFSAYERPFEQVVRRMADLAGLRLTMRDGVLRIELDEPFHVNYKVGYLNIVRNTTSIVGISSSVAEGGGSSTDGGASSSTITGSSTADFWQELTNNLRQIITNTGRLSGLIAPPAQQLQLALESIAASSPPTDTPAAAGDTQAAQVAELLSALGYGATGSQTAQAGGGTTAAGGQPAAGNVAGAPVQTAAQARDADSFFTVNRQAGIVSVFGTQREHKAVSAYLERLHASVTSQVLIEAKILEVSLNDEYRFGINWVSLFRGGTNFAAPFNTTVTGLVTPPAFDQLISPTGVGNLGTADVLTFAFGGEDLNAIANLVEEFGTVRALSSPRLTVMQNQTAVLKVAEEQVFFELEVEPGTVTAGVATASAFTSTVNTVTVGLVMTVQASINLDTDEITLTLRPTITSVATFVNDPAVAIEAARAGAGGVVSPVPEVTVQEIDTVISLQSGSVIVIGGLMQDRTTVDETGIPGLSDLPWIGSAFKSKSRNTEKTELVIFLRATIIRNDPVDPYDIDLYKLFGEDRRPLEF